MSVKGVEGSAGCGKTHRLMEMVHEHVAEHDMLDEQRVLGLTFMHGSRQRLQSRLRSVPGLNGRFDCVTIDSFARRIFMRWRSMAAEIGVQFPDLADFDALADCAARLLESQEVRAWIGSAYPVVVVDEAQDLKPARLNMVRSLASATAMFVAADEFQCLDTELRPNDAVAWLRSACKPQVLTEPRRTKNVALLEAAAAIRDGRPTIAGPGFSMRHAVGIGRAAYCLSEAIRRSAGHVAIITPTRRGFVNGIVEMVQRGTPRCGPYPIRWERLEQEDAAALVARLGLPSHDMTLSDALERLRSESDHPAIRQTERWARHQGALGRERFSEREIVAALERQIALRKAFGARDDYGLPAMTIHQAKNREFDSVVVLWPLGVGGDEEQQRRLLYNAVTRSKSQCLVITQRESQLHRAPFA